MVKGQLQIQDEGDLNIPDTIGFVYDDNSMYWDGSLLGFLENYPLIESEFISINNSIKDRKLKIVYSGNFKDDFYSILLELMRKFSLKMISSNHRIERLVLIDVNESIIEKKINLPGSFKILDGKHHFKNTSIARVFHVISKKNNLHFSSIQKEFKEIKINTVFILPTIETTKECQKFLEKIGIFCDIKKENYSLITHQIK